MLLQMKCPYGTVIPKGAEEKPRTITLSAATVIVKQHGLDFLILLTVLAVIGYASI